MDCAGRSNQIAAVPFSAGLGTPAFLSLVRDARAWEDLLASLLPPRFSFQPEPLVDLLLGQLLVLG